MAIAYPMKRFQVRNIVLARKICAFIWFSGLCLAVPALIGFFQNEMEKNGKPYMFCDFTYGKQVLNRYYMSVCAITFAIPSLVMIIVYSKMFMMIFSIIGNSELEQENDVRKQLKKSSRRAAKIVFLIVAVFWCCYTPFWIKQILMMYYGTHITSRRLRMLVLTSLLVSYLNSMINPFLYTLMPEKYNVWRSIRSKYYKYIKSAKKQVFEKIVMNSVAKQHSSSIR